MDGWLSQHVLAPSVRSVLAFSLRIVYCTNICAEIKDGVEKLLGICFQIVIAGEEGV